MSHREQQNWEREEEVKSGEKITPSSVGKGQYRRYLQQLHSVTLGGKTSQRRKETTPTLRKDAAKQESQCITIISSRVLRPQFTMIQLNRSKNYSGHV